jgi:2-amino-4-hydroxy-6-hydroxymethyldihydropteridine diphosphokinase
MSRPSKPDGAPKNQRSNKPSKLDDSSPRKARSFGSDDAPRERRRPDDREEKPRPQRTRPDQPGDVRKSRVNTDRDAPHNRSRDDRDEKPRPQRPRPDRNEGEERKPRIYTAKDAPTARKREESGTEKPTRERSVRPMRSDNSPKRTSKYNDDPSRDRNKRDDKPTGKPKYRAGDGPQKSKIFGEDYTPKMRPKDKDEKTGADRTGAGNPAFGPKKYINVYLSIGSNMGKRRENLMAAVTQIHKGIGKVARQSSVYETQPWGKTDQAAFLNQVIMINTISTPKDVLTDILKIEKDMGRDRKEKWGPRIIDIDILMYGKRIVKDKMLEIPHPEMHNRAFVLVPFMEIAPELMHPVLGKPIDELYINCEDLSDVVRLDELPR